MQRATGTGFIGFGLVLIVVGAILKFAVTADANGFDIETAGLIAIWVGVVSLLLGILLVVMGGRSHSTVRDNVVQTSAGTEHVQERDDYNSAI
jgi:hypothetical protein